MTSPNLANPWLSYAPAVLLSISGLGVAGILGGPIAAAIAAIAAVPALVAACVVTFVVRIKFKASTTYGALGLGLGLYVAAIVVVLICLALLGPSQIM